MARDSSVYLEDIATAGERITHYLTGYTRATFEADTKTVDAVVRNLEIIGEAVKKIPAEVRDKVPGLTEQVKGLLARE